MECGLVITPTEGECGLVITPTEGECGLVITPTEGECGLVITPTEGESKFCPGIIRIFCHEGDFVIQQTFLLLAFGF